MCLIGFGLAMDATAVSISNGMAECKMKYNKIITIAICFGIFQGLMPIFGYYFGRFFADYLDAIDNYVVFIILGVLGIKMIIEANKEDSCKGELTFTKIILQGVATSIDALMVGVTFAIMHVYIYKASLIITIITIIMSFIGVLIGCKFGKNYKQKAEVLGGIILIVLALKFLIEGII